MKIENDYLIFDKYDYLKNKKITATNITALLGENKFKKKGDALLYMFGVYSSEIDDFYQKRGAIAEEILRKKLTDKKYEIKFWNSKDIAYDNFHRNKDFGGMIDIAITKPMRCVVECKSKNIKDYRNTRKFKNNDYETQALFYGYMSNCEKIKLIYVFFTDKQEKKIRNDVPLDINEEEFVFYGYDLELNKEDMIEKLKKCKEYKDRCYKERRIPIKDISEDILKELMEEEMVNEENYNEDCFDL